jgi:ribonuclease VapC
LRYGKGRHKAALNIGDCVSYALTIAWEAPLLFKGNAFPHTDIQPAVRTALGMNSSNMSELRS